MFPLRTHIPIPPAYAPMPWRDVGLLDLARHAVMGAAPPVGRVEADTAALFDALRARAEAMGPGAADDDVFDALEPVAYDLARARAARLAA